MCLGAGWNAEAISDFDHAISLDPSLVDAYLGRGVANKRMGNYDGAIVDYDRAIALRPSYEDAFYNRGNARYCKADYDGALADFNRAIELNPRNADAFNNRGLTKDILGDFDGAKADYERAIALNPNDAYARFWLTLILRREHAEESPAGLKDSKTAWNSGWSKNVGSFLLGRISETELMTRARQGEAKDVQDQLNESYYYAGMSHLFQGDRKTAKELFERSVATGKQGFGEHDLAQAEIGRIARSP